MSSLNPLIDDRALDGMLPPLPDDARKLEAILVSLGYSPRVEGLDDDQRALAIEDRYHLNKFEVEMGRHLVEGRTPDKARAAMAISQPTAERTLADLKIKLGVSTVAGIRERFGGGR